MAPFSPRRMTADRELSDKIRGVAMGPAVLARLVASAMEAPRATPQRVPAMMPNFMAGFADAILSEQQLGQCNDMGGGSPGGVSLQ